MLDAEVLAETSAPSVPLEAGDLPKLEYPASLALLVVTPEPLFAVVGEKPPDEAVKLVVLLLVGCDGDICDLAIVFEKPAAAVVGWVLPNEAGSVVSLVLLGDGGDVCVPRN